VATPRKQNKTARSRSASRANVDFFQTSKYEYTPKHINNRTTGYDSDIPRFTSYTDYEAMMRQKNKTIQSSTVRNREDRVQSLPANAYSATAVSSTISAEPPSTNSKNVLPAKLNSNSTVEDEQRTRSRTNSSIFGNKRVQQDKTSTGSTIVNDDDKASKPLCCDKCDGKHETENCPYYKKNRDTHPDAQKNFYKKIGGTSNLPGISVESINYNLFFI
jgi:hypothetical protein